MKTIQLSLIVVGCLFFVAPFASMAQMGRENRIKDQREKIEAHKIAFFTEKLDLSPKEAEKFWPIYNAHRDKMEAQHKTFRKEFDFTPEEVANMTDEEALKFIDAKLDHDKKVMELDMQFAEQLKQVLPPQKIIILFGAEKEFRENLIRQVAGRRGPPEPGR